MQDNRSKYTLFHAVKTYTHTHTHTYVHTHMHTCFKWFIMFSAGSLILKTIAWHLIQCWMSINGIMEWGQELIKLCVNMRLLLTIQPRTHPLLCALSCSVCWRLTLGCLPPLATSLSLESFSLSLLMSHILSRGQKWIKSPVRGLDGNHGTQGGEQRPAMVTGQHQTAWFRQYGSTIGQDANIRRRCVCEPRMSTQHILYISSSNREQLEASVAISSFELIFWGWWSKYKIVFRARHLRCLVH